MRSPLIPEMATLLAGVLEPFRALIEALPDAIVVVDHTSTIVLVNVQAERLFGYSRDELLGEPVDILVPERLRDAHHGHRADFFRAASLRPMGPAVGDLRAARRDRSEFPADISLSPLGSSSGTLVICAIRDVTLQRAARHDAERAAHRKDEFLATLSHELRTPLNAVLGWARMLESGHLPAERAAHAIAAIGRNAAALAHMVDDLLDTSRTLEGVIRLARATVDVVDVAQVALDAVRPLADARNVLLMLHGSPEDRTVSGDAGRLTQVMWNLLTNAINFTPAGGRVDVYVESSSGHIEIRVADTGKGISPDFLPSVFERFRQSDDATTERHTGLGLGLSIVRQLVALHGGTVRATSPGTGLGATFTVRLPASHGDVDVDATAPTPLRPRLDGLRILIVDADADGRTLTSLILTQAGAHTWATASVREALQVLETERPDALVSDIDLADEDGFELIRQVRAREAAHGGFLPAVALTGYARAEDRARALAAGFQAHTPKPVEPDTLAATVAAVTGLVAG